MWACQTTKLVRGNKLISMEMRDSQVQSQYARYFTSSQVKLSVS